MNLPREKLSIFNPLIMKLTNLLQDHTSNCIMLFANTCHMPVCSFRIPKPIEGQLKV
jgi:hypothetical protein